MTDNEVIICIFIQVEELTGLTKSQITLSEEGLSTLIKSYCRWGRGGGEIFVPLTYFLQGIRG